MEEIKEPVYGYVLLSDEEMAKQLNMSKQTIKKYHKQLIKLGYLEILNVNGREIKKFKIN